MEFSELVDAERQREAERVELEAAERNRRNQIEDRRTRLYQAFERLRNFGPEYWHFKTGGYPGGDDYPPPPLPRAYWVDKAKMVESVAAVLVSDDWAVMLAALPPDSDVAKALAVGLLTHMTDGTKTELLATQLEEWKSDHDQTKLGPRVMAWLCVRLCNELLLVDQERTRSPVIAPAVKPPAAAPLHQEVNPPEAWQDHGKQLYRLAVALWDGKPKSVDALHNTAWHGKEVTDEAIDKAIQRLNEKIESDGYVITTKNRRATLDRIGKPTDKSGDK